MNIKHISLPLMLLGFMAVTVHGAEKQAVQDPIAVVGHGTMLDSVGKKIDMSHDFMQKAQQYYLNNLKQQVVSSMLLKLREFNRGLEKIPRHMGVDQIQRDALAIDWLLQRMPTRLAEPVKLKIKTLNERYLIDVLKVDLRKVSVDYETGLPGYLLPYTGRDRQSSSRMSTNSGGQAYIDECRKAGVPIPPSFNGGNWDSGDWTHNGDLDPDFLSISPTADVYYHESSAPDGTCIALPRRDGNAVSAMGLICLSRETGNACIWDRGATDLDEALSVSDFVGGVDLTNGTCSDCHAGENPFIVHPEIQTESGPGFAWFTQLACSSGEAQLATKPRPADRAGSGAAWPGRQQLSGLPHQSIRWSVS